MALTAALTVPMVTVGVTGMVTERVVGPTVTMSKR